jgi:hypothetical protein
MTGAVIRMRPPGGPIAAYLAERERLGFPSRPGDLGRRCTWCRSAPGEPCRNRATGRRRQPHHARQAAS